MIVPIVATHATLEPVTAPKPPHANTEAMPSPPRSRPSQRCKNSYRSPAIPVVAVSCPMKMNSGMQTMTKSVPLSQVTSVTWERV